MCQRYTLQNGMLIACYLKVWLFFSGAMMIVILATDDQMVRCGSRSSGRGLFEETVAMCAMLVGGARCACAFRKLRFGDVLYLHAFHAFSAFPVEAHLVLCLLLPCRVRCIANAQGSVFRLARTAF